MTDNTYRAADLAGAGDGDEREDEQPVVEVAEPVAREHRQREQSPEGGVAEAFGVAAVEEAKQREEREDGAREKIDVAEGDHAPRSPIVRILRSRRRRRKPWIRKAAIAVGIAQSEKCSGSIS